jgi:Tfp pilus assembly protein PilF
MGMSYFRLGNEEQGRRWLYAALQEDPWHAQAHQALAERYEQEGQTALAAPHRQFLQQGSRPAAQGSFPRGR